MILIVKIGLDIVHSVFHDSPLSYIYYKFKYFRYISDTKVELKHSDPPSRSALHMLVISHCTVKSLLTPSLAVVEHEFSDPFDSTVGSIHRHALNHQRFHCSFPLSSHS